jgi:hypothetical protein
MVSRIVTDSLSSWFGVEGLTRLRLAEAATPCKIRRSVHGRRESTRARAARSEPPDVIAFQGLTTVDDSAIDATQIVLVFRS